MTHTKCPASGCTATGFEVVHMEGIGNLLVCDAGHVISRDYSHEYRLMVDELSGAIAGLGMTIAGHMTALRQDMAKAVDDFKKHDN